MSIHVGNREAPIKTGIWRSIRGVTIAEFAIVAAMLVIAFGASGSSRFQPAKDDSCYHRQIRCTAALALLAYGNEAVPALERDRPEQDWVAAGVAVRALRPDQKPAERRTVAQLSGSEGRKTTSPLTESPGSTGR